MNKWLQAELVGYHCAPFFHYEALMLVPGVGILFEAYYYLHGTERDRKIYDTFFTDNKMVDQQYRDLLLRRFAQPFAAYVACLALTRTRGRCKPRCSTFLS